MEKWSSWAAGRGRRVLGVNHDIKIDTEMRMAYKQTNTHINSDFLTNKREMSDNYDDSMTWRASVSAVTRHLRSSSEKQRNIPKVFFSIPSDAVTLSHISLKCNLGLCLTALQLRDISLCFVDASVLSVIIIIIWERVMFSMFFEMAPPSMEAAWGRY